MNNHKYKLSLTENQLDVVKIALEDYFRTRMNQWFDFATEVAQNGYEYDKENPNNSKLFDEYIQRRNDSKELFEKAFAVAVPDPFARKSTPAMQTAIDIWHVIRYLQWQERPEPKSHMTTDAYPPFRISDDPLPVIEEIANEKPAGDE